MKKKSIVIQFDSSRSPFRMTTSPFTMLLLELCHPFYFKPCFPGVFNLPVIFLSWVCRQAKLISWLVSRSVCLSITYTYNLHTCSTRCWMTESSIWESSTRVSLQWAQKHCFFKKRSLANDLLTIQSNSFWFLDD